MNTQATSAGNADKPGRSNQNAFNVWKPLLVFMSFTLAISVAGYVVFQRYKESIRTEKQAELGGITELKTRQITTWMVERRGDAQALKDDPLFTDAVGDWLQHGGPAGGTSEKLAARLSSMQQAYAAYGYTSISLFDNQAMLRLSSAADEAPILGMEKLRLLESMRSGQIVFSEIHREKINSGERIEIELRAPLTRVKNGKARSIGAVLFRIDPNRFLFPLIQRWPTTSPSAENLLVRRDGDEVVFLNELRHRKNTALAMRLPLSQKQLLAAMAVMGQEGLVEGMDHRGVPVVGVLGKVPGTSWFIVSKIDKAEIYAPINQLANWMLLLMLALIGAGGGIAVFWRKKEHKQHESKLERQALAKHLDYLGKYANDIILLLDSTGKIIDFNDRALEAYGYSAAELSGLNIDDLRVIDFSDPLAERFRQIDQAGGALVFDSTHVRRNGAVFSVEASVRLIDLAGEKFYQGILRDITERKQAEVLAHRFGNLLQGSFNEIYMFDAHSLHFILVSEGAKKNLGYRDDELSQLTPLDIKPSFTRESFELLIAPLRTGEQPSLFFENVHRRKNGTTYPVEVRLQLMQGESPVFLAIIQDITEREKTGLELCIAATAFESQEGMMVTDADGVILRVNHAFTKITGYTMEEVMGKNPRVLKSGCQDANFYAVMWENINRTGGWQGEIWNRRKNGEVYPEFVTITAVKDKNSNTNNYVATFNDITERMQAAEMLRKAAEETADLYDHAPCGYHSLDQDGVCKRINDTELAWLGYTRDEVIGKMKWTDLLAPAGIQTFSETFPKLMKQGFVHDLELEIIRKDGTLFVGLINATAIYDPSGNFVMSRSTVTDITKRKQAEAAMRDLTAHLQTVRDEEQTRIARDIHDDLGGTLTALKMETYGLDANCTGCKDAAPMFERVKAMSQLLDDAVSATRRVITELHPIILDDLGLQAALEWQAGQFHKRTGIECRIVCTKDDDCKTELAKIHTINLFRIFQESLTNVTRHSGASSVEIEFHHGEEIILSIRDNGCGLPEWHAIASTSYGMRGMTERVKQLGGKIEFDSKPGGGLAVTVRLSSRFAFSLERAEP